MKKLSKAIVDRDRFLAQIPDGPDRRLLAELMEDYEEVFGCIPKHVEPTEIDYAMLAAYIDGEGCLAIKRIRSNRKGLCYLPWVSISNTDPRLPWWLLVRFRGTVRLIERKTKQPNRAQAYEWRLCSKKELNGILERCLPYLVIKREQAGLLIRLMALTSKPGQRANDQHLLEKEYLKQAVHSMKAVFKQVPEPLLGKDGEYVN